MPAPCRDRPRPERRHDRGQTGEFMTSPQTRIPTMSSSESFPARCQLAAGLEISRIVTGLWQVADMERDGSPLDLGRAAAAMTDYAAAGFDTFDMADHNGSAERMAGPSPAGAPADR